MDRIRAPIRCFLSEIPEKVAAEQKDPSRRPQENIQLRIIGTIVSIESNPSTTTLTLDDGTALAHVLSLPHKATDISSRPGMTVECIVNFANETGGALVVEKIFALPDDSHEDALRWLELSYRKQHQQQSTTPQQNDDNWPGYPRRKIGPEDISMVITGVCRPDEDTSRPQAGASLVELAKCFNLDENDALAMIQELQGDGLIYQNEHGRYVPL